MKPIAIIYEDENKFEIREDVTECNVFGKITELEERINELEQVIIIVRENGGILKGSRKSEDF